MGVMRRVRDITVAHLHEQLERAEDPVRVIDNYLLDLAEHIREAENLLNQCRQHTASLKHQWQNAERQMQKREAQALLAAKAGEDHLARLALNEKLLHEESSAQYKELYEQSQASVDDLTAELAEMKSDYQDVYNKRQYYLARLETVRLRQRMNQHLQRGGMRDGERWFGRLEERISDMELEAQSLRDIRRMGQEAPLHGGTNLTHMLDEEMAKLKAKLAQDAQEGKERA